MPSKKDVKKIFSEAMKLFAEGEARDSEPESRESTASASRKPYSAREAAFMILQKQLAASQKDQQDKNESELSR